MSINTKKLKKHLKQFNFEDLFNEMGWDYMDTQWEIIVNGNTYNLNGFAHKRGFWAIECPMEPGEDIPEHPIRRKIDKEVEKFAQEHILIFTHHQEKKQLWQWIRKEQGKTAALRTHRYNINQSGDSLIQKIEKMCFDIAEEGNVDLTEVTRRVTSALDIDRVTKKFYDKFKKQREKFQKFIQNLPDKNQSWYTSVMINRIMFIYFIQKKGFLDDDFNYLKNKLKESRDRGNDLFYKDFLCPLFFEGFAKREKNRSPETNRLLGDIPYLDGGLFQKHYIEKQHGDSIKIPDEAFGNLFVFFDQYQWHLDERPLKNDNEINPDVLGYIFEKYINQKQMGAYYTKEDITDYISRNTILPFLLDKVKKKCSDVFKPGGFVWELLKSDPDGYIYPSVRKGAELPLPEEIAEGIGDVSKRTLWNTPTPDEFANPTEIWRETVARRQRYQEVKQKIEKGEISVINDLITYNLDIRKFVRDLLISIDDEKFINEFWKAMAGQIPGKSNEKFKNGVTVLDPTCGSGAFLFAALNILEPLYEECLDRMEYFIKQDEESDEKSHAQKFSGFKSILEDVKKHPNHRYYIFKTIILNNLYGVDIMEEAVEICKLRLFLKLAAQVETKKNLEPLPDIDFNIKAGNTLVGFAKEEEIREAITTDMYGSGAEQMRMVFGEDEEILEKIKINAEIIDTSYNEFRRMQVKSGTKAKDQREAKVDLQLKLNNLEDQLNRYLAKEYGVDPDGKAGKAKKNKAGAKLPVAKSKGKSSSKKSKKKKGEVEKLTYEKWLKTHKPFHWFIEFYGIMKDGGFDVIIGNPPYVEYREIKKEYTVNKYVTLECKDIYAFVLERIYSINKQNSSIGVIVPISIFGTDGFEKIQNLSLDSFSYLWISFFANRPSQLFRGAQKRITILVGKKSNLQTKQIFTTSYLRWRRDEWDSLFNSRITYNQRKIFNLVFSASIEKLGNDLEKSIFNKLIEREECIGDSLSTKSPYIVYYTRKFGYFLAFLNFIPSIIDIKTKEIKQPSELKFLEFKKSEYSYSIISVLTSSTFFWFWNKLSDCRNLNKRDILAFPFNPQKNDKKLINKLSNAAKKYITELKNTSHTMQKSGLHIETFNYSQNKPIIDQIDRILAQHYGFTDEELDFIINYDIKYRMGDELKNDNLS